MKIKPCGTCGTLYCVCCEAEMYAELQVENYHEEHYGVE